jgi:hypothetical protein
MSWYDPKDDDSNEDARERELRGRAESSHELIVERARALTQALKAELDPRETVRRNPMTSLASGLAAGFLLDAVRSVMPGSASEDDDHEPSSPLASLISGISRLSSLVPTVAPLAMWMLKRSNRRG